MSIKFDLLELNSPSLLTSAAQIRDMKFESREDCGESWQLKSWEQISAHINDDTFPCIFAKKAMDQKYLLLTFIDGWETVAALDHFCSCVMEYVETLKEKYGTHTVCPPLMAIFKPNEKLVESHQYSNASWYILQYLHYNDNFSWPENIPADPDDPIWSFCFNGYQLFVNITSPVLGKHRSRVLSDSLVFTIQPRTNFDIVAGRDTPYGPKVRQKIRERWMEYDGIEGHLDYSMYGDEHNREWKQYFLYSDESPAPSRCPLNIKHK
ncbi:YqcI/YcgG family protein [Agrobacterium rhizogenes]|uniref:YqcI/YcgG family protein n=1 Tax=Rhizobium rhizogenes TaxID=359 RepID=UPI001572A834|nr:YqcI/YcgG family protein [Rhizobium rhizogenes]NTG51708.1 YqcI/YcgG family protein [Rhizobium rhizogenes]